MIAGKDDRLYEMFFFFQAEDGIRDWSVTGVQTCALPIWDVMHHNTIGLSLLKNKK